MLTDGERLFFADFGLVLDADFDLAPDERAFLAGHRFFDIGEFLAELDWTAPDRTVAPSRAYERAISTFRPVIAEMTGVFDRLMNGPKSGGGYHDSTIERLLDQM